MKINQLLLLGLIVNLPLIFYCGNKDLSVFQEMKSSPDTIFPPNLFTTYIPTIEFSWKTVVGAQKYQIFINHKLSGETTEDKISIELDTVTDQYNWWVVANNDFQYVYSSVNVFHVLPSKINLTTPGDNFSACGQIDIFRWETENDLLNQFTISISDSSNNNSILENISGTLYSPPTPMGSGTYTWFVSFLRSDGVEVISETWTFTITELTPPTNVSQLPPGCPGLNNSVSWAGGNLFDLDLLLPDGTWESILTNTTSTSYSNNTLPDGNNYNWRVRQTSSNGCTSDWLLFEAYNIGAMVIPYGVKEIRYEFSWSCIQEYDIHVLTPPPWNEAFHFVNDYGTYGSTTVQILNHEIYDTCDTFFPSPPCTEQLIISAPDSILCGHYVVWFRNFENAPNPCAAEYKLYIDGAYVLTDTGQANFPPNDDYTVPDVNDWIASCSNVSC